ncbi:hypothetical protein PVAND_012338 [Polypedilum vanderplanki]|uniref:FKRP stem domain-containing protein n=1 Tax=Polypedilum vanderplanki TaxID=319348 RepID=A0A9J6CM59_POLVA|nr:hypothetical protein PVAND_012338 [Polypedilum vanderplanki]
MRMRIRISKFAILCILVINLLLVFISWKYFTTENTLQRNNSYSEPSFSDIRLETTVKTSRNRVHELKKFLHKSLTVVIRDFYHFDNDLKYGIDHLLNFLPELKILIVSDEQYPYPPINIFTSIQNPNQTSKPSTLIYKENVQFLPLPIDITKSSSEMNPLTYIQTKYVLFLPDNFKLSNGRQMFNRLIKSIDDENNRHERGIRKILIIPFASNQKHYNYCFQINADIQNWNIEYIVKNSTKNCDLYTGKHAILLETVLLHNFPQPFDSPFPEYFYLQAKFSNCKLKYSNETFLDGGKKLMSSYHSRMKRKNLKKEQFKALYKKLQFKKVVKKYHFIPEDKTSLKSLKKNRGKGNNKLYNEKNLKSNTNVKATSKDGREIDVLIEQLEVPSSFFQYSNRSAQVQINTDISYFGCEKNTKSCIGQVYNEKPFYLYLNRHTPPCCLEKLKNIFKYVVEELENTGIRYWLDNKVLSDIVEFNDLSNDAYEIDISFNVNDYNRSTAVRRCFDSRPFTDLAGYYWYKATDGHYLKIQYSKTNEIHINLLPYEIKNDKMIAKGFFGAKAKSFSIEFLHPMSTVSFLGRNVFIPNNVRSYLNVKGFKVNSSD